MPEKLIDRLLGAGALDNDAQVWLRHQLLRFTEPRDRRAWLESPHPNLDGDKPIDRLEREPARVACLLGGRRFYPHAPQGAGARVSPSSK